MKVKLSFIDDKWYGKVIRVDPTRCAKICGEGAMNMLFEQEHGEHRNVVIFYKRGDIPSVLNQAESSLTVNTFSSENFSWYFINKDYLNSLLHTIE